MAQIPIHERTPFEGMIELAEHSERLQRFSEASDLYIGTGLFFPALAAAKKSGRKEQVTKVCEAGIAHYKQLADEHIWRDGYDRYRAKHGHFELTLTLTELQDN